jgi:hypothetical protein
MQRHGNSLMQMHDQNLTCGWLCSPPTSHHACHAHPTSSTAPSPPPPPKTPTPSPAPPPTCEMGPSKCALKAPCVPSGSVMRPRLPDLVHSSSGLNQRTHQHPPTPGSQGPPLHLAPPTHPLQAPSPNPPFKNTQHTCEIGPSKRALNAPWVPRGSVMRPRRPDLVHSSSGLNQRTSSGLKNIRRTTARVLCTRTG